MWGLRCSLETRSSPLISAAPGEGSAEPSERLDLMRPLVTTKLMRFSALSPFILLSVLGCSMHSGLHARPPYPAPLPETLNPIEALGYEIYRQDEAAWKATDAALESGLEDTPSSGWLALISEGGWRVRFIGPCGAEACAYMDVEQRIVALAPTVFPRDRAALSDDEAAMWRARETALASDFRRCTAQYNTAVVPDELEGEPVWRVYLLASSSDARDVVLAGHHRVTTSYDGRAILAHEPLSKSCLVPRVVDETSAMVVTHLLHPTPIETHVFTSLTYRIPIFVGASGGQFKVEGTKITRISGP